ncbi:MAG: hypothetical protein WC627_12140 [Legionella sp.]|jgi:hypothetical protein
MKYKVTSHFYKSKERLIAAFSKEDDAKTFIQEKIIKDEGLKQTIVYELYDDLSWIYEFNNQMGLARELEDPEAFDDESCLFSVVTQSDQNPERTPIALFHNKEDAYLFISSKCATNYHDNFMIFKGKLLVDTLNKNILMHKVLKDSIPSDHSKGESLSPFTTKPSLPGGPIDFWVEKKDDEN